MTLCKGHQLSAMRLGSQGFHIPVCRSAVVLLEVPFISVTSPFESTTVAPSLKATDFRGFL